MKKIIYFIILLSLIAAWMPMKIRLLKQAKSLLSASYCPLLLFHKMKALKNYHITFIIIHLIWTQKDFYFLLIQFLKEKGRLWLLDANTQIPYFMEPGDTIFAYYDEQRSINFSSNNQQRNYELKLIEKLVSETGAIFDLFNIDKQLNLKENGLIPYNNNKIKTT